MTLPPESKAAEFVAPTDVCIGLAEIVDTAYVGVHSLLWF